MICDMRSSLLRARDAAARCGVTRLADVTQLDRIGVPVYQAVRPWSRALSVHQGKGLDPAVAQIGALMEAVESDHAETYAAEGVVCSYTELPPGERTSDLADFACDRRRPPSRQAPIRWVEGRTALEDRRIWIPFDMVSLDFTRNLPSRLDRTSSGLAAHFDREAACRTALLEVIERDAVGAWMRQGMSDRMATRIDLDTVPFPWFQRLRGRLSVAGLRLAAYRARAVIAASVFVCELIEPEAVALGRGAVYGSACRTDPEDALLGALLEAIQSRLTEIVGARDDIDLPRPQTPEPAPFGFSMPPPIGMDLLDWSDAAFEPPGTGARALAQDLRDAGYDQAAIVDLTRPDEDVVVVKAFAPGLGSMDRARATRDAGAC
jgi:ribosomal protein S12 methylthiotransferase accessory factor